ncbi:low molecular weight protein-tyrosine-phosphatase [Fodinicurvata fenggangensis]|uniref:low molecular weight protein-tyrosine-phosphatase n=1 Tax=Fodinicurvata fenggangensis TaxID=1121830 RepID=UPI000B074E0C|nr:low molecular weight protein-tyrosine-phosphatase [Fodinicurvata fenggangensis]
MRILFVCTGNICRSPTAEGVLKRKLREGGLDHLRVDSAGTHGYHIGESPDPRACEKAAQRGYDLNDQSARRIAMEDFERFDWIIAMDRGHLKQLQRLCPPEATAEIHLFRDFLGAPHAGQDVPDPYYGALGGFDEVLDLVEAGCDAILERLETTPPER